MLIFVKGPKKSKTARMIRALKKAQVRDIWNEMNKTTMRSCNWRLYYKRTEFFT
jgi:hypothetical protein